MVHRSRWNDYHNDDTYFARPPIFFYRLNAFLKLKNIILRRGVPRYKPCSMNPAPACTLASSFLPLVSLFLSVLPLRFLVGIALLRRRFLPLFLPLSLSLSSLLPLPLSLVALALCCEKEEEEDWNPGRYTFETKAAGKGFSRGARC